MTRIIGRILSLGFPMPGVLCDNYNVVSAPSFFDYDAIIVEPKVTSALIDGILSGETEATTFTRQAVRATPSGHTDVSLADVLRRRRDETARLLENGGVVVVFGYPPQSCTLPDGRTLDGHWWLPLPDGLSLAPPLLVSGEGSTAQVVDWEHPFAAFVASQAANINYRAHFAVRQIEGARVFATSVGGAAIGVELPLPRGTLVLLPALKAPPQGNARYAVSDVMQDGIRRMLGAIAPGQTPTWARGMTLPGQAERFAALRAAQDAARSATQAVEDARAEYEGLERFQRLLWQEGTAGLIEPGLAALEKLGFTVHARDLNNVEIRCTEGSALVDFAAGERPIDMPAHHRLRQRIERAIEKRGSAPRGILFVNGERLQPPVKRTHVTNAVRIAAETMRYCIAPTPGLFEAVAAVLGGDEAAAVEYRRKLLATDGLLA